MIAGTTVFCLDGDFRRSQPTHERYSFRSPEGQWFVVACGPRYSNQYQVTEFDAEGEAWLRAHDRTDAPPVAPVPPPSEIQGGRLAL